MDQKSSVGKMVNLLSKRLMEKRSQTSPQVVEKKNGQRDIFLSILFVSANDFMNSHGFIRSSTAQTTMNLLGSMHGNCFPCEGNNSMKHLFSKITGGGSGSSSSMEETFAIVDDDNLRYIPQQQIFFLAFVINSTFVTKKYSL